VKNVLTGLRKQEVVEPTGEVENRTERVRLTVPASLSLYRDGDDSSIHSQREVFELAHEFLGNGKGGAG
jgi:hypothetical protein